MRNKIGRYAALFLLVSVFLIVLAPSRVQAYVTDVNSSGTYTSTAAEKTYSITPDVNGYWKVRIQAGNGANLTIKKFSSTYTWVTDSLYIAPVTAATYAEIESQKRVLSEGKSISLEKGDYWLYLTDHGSRRINLTFSLRDLVVATGVVWEVDGKQVSGSASVTSGVPVTVKATLQPENTDSVIDSETSLSNTIRGYGGIENIKISADKRSVSFTYGMSKAGSSDTIKLLVKDSNDVNSKTTPYTLVMNIRADAIIVDNDLVTSTYNSFMITEKSPTGYLIGYLKQGSKWVKKFDEKRGKTHIIKGLKPNKKYTVKLVTYEKKGGPKSLPITVKFKTGTKTKPQIKSVKITNLKQNGVTWTRGYWQGRNYIWPHQVTSYTYTLKVTLKKKAPSGVKGLEYNGYRASGRKKVYTFNITGAKPASKGAFRFYSHKTYGAFSPKSKKVKIR